MDASETPHAQDAVARGNAHDRPPPPPPGEDWALFLDVDGCLLEFADAPDRVVVPPTLRQTLLRLQDGLDGALALVSGRTIDALDDLFWPLKFDLAGLHGNELRTSDGRVRRARACPGLAEVRAEAIGLSLRHPGSVVEHKGAGIALHWRGAPAAEEAMRALAERALARLDGYRLQPGHCVLELLRGDADKGSAILELLEAPPFRGRVPVFAGDDLTDEAGFRAVNARGGLGVLVGARRDSAARHALRDPAQVRAWLDRFAPRPRAADPHAAERPAPSPHSENDPPA